MRKSEHMTIDQFRIKISEVLWASKSAKNGHAVAVLLNSLLPVLEQAMLELPVPVIRDNISLKRVRSFQQILLTYTHICTKIEGQDGPDVQTAPSTEQ